MHNIIEFGAVGDGTTLNTRAIQQALDTLSSQGGGTLVFPTGTWLTGTLYLRSHVTLWLEAGATLLASPNIDDYPADTHYQRYDNEQGLDRCCLYAEDAHHISIKGEGTLHGNGAAFVDGVRKDQYRPMLLRMLRCEHITLEGIAIEEPAAWSTAFLECKGIIARALRIHNTLNRNGDGLDFDCCENISISDCHFVTTDDCICLQNSVPGSTCGNVTITNCVMTSRWAGIRIGLLSSGDLEDVSVSNCIIHDMQCSGLKIQSTEGGTIRNMVFQNLVMRNVSRPVFITLNHFHIGTDARAEPPRTGSIHDLSFDHLRLYANEDFDPGTAPGIVIIGTPGFPVRDIDFSHINYTYPVQAERSYPTQASLPEMEDCRPEFFVYPEGLPADALFLNHVEGFTAQHLRLKPLATAKPGIPVKVMHSRNVFINGDVYD